MEVTTLNITQYLEHLLGATEPLRVRRQPNGVQWADEALHGAAYAGDPEMYALLALVDGATEQQRARVLFALLKGSWAELGDEQRRTLRQVAGVLLSILPADTVLTVFMGLRRARVNHKHAARAIVGYILNHPELAGMIAQRRPTVAAALEHALGRDVVRGAVRMLNEGDPEGYAQRHLLRFAHDGAGARQLLAGLYTSGGENVPATGEEAAPYSVAHLPYLQGIEQSLKTPKTVTATNRGDIAATLVHLYRGGSSAELEAALDEYVNMVAEGLPRFGGAVALVLDTSASMRGYGEREFAILSQAVALRLLLERVCGELRVFAAAGARLLPPPQGATDLAGPLLDALATAPDLALIVSDGYENSYSGDLARVVASLGGAEVATPVAFVHSMFSPADDLSYRLPASSLPQFTLWHEADFERLLIRLFLLAGPAGEAGVREFLRGKLDRAGKEVTPWTTAS